MHPIEIKMFKDDNNHACIEATGEWQGFAEFVSTDLQESLVNTEQVLSMLRHSDSAHDKLMGSFIGNAHELRITGDHVEIENQIDDEQECPLGSLGNEDMKRETKESRHKKQFEQTH